MKRALFGSLGLLLVLAVATPFCVSVRRDSTSVEGEGDAADARSAEPAASSDAGSSWTPKRLRNRAFDVASPPETARPDRVAFLPTLNRSPRKVHATFLRAIDTTLAAHASLFEGRSTASPELIDALLRTEGFPEWFAGPTRFQYGPALLARLHRATGAGVMVWAEILDGGGVMLHASAMMEGADPAPWQDVALAGGDDLDRVLYDAPRALLARLQELGRIAGGPTEDSDSGPGAADLAALEEARGLVWAGDPASFVRAEQALARLITERPHWPEPWIELAFLRVARPLLFEPHALHALMNEGPIAARHLAYTLPALSESQRARLAFIDHLFTGHRQSSAEYAAVIEALPRPSLERALLAIFHPTQDPTRFGIEPMPGYGALGRILFEMSTQPGPGPRAAHAAEMLEADDAPASGSALALVLARDHYTTQKSSAGERAVWTSMTAHAAAQAVEVLRESCSTLNGSVIAGCRDSLYALVNEYLAPAALESVGLDDETTWRKASERFASQVASGELPDEPLHPIPPVVLDARDPDFAGFWYAIYRLMGTANDVFAVAPAVVVEGDDAISLIVGSARSRMLRSLDWLVMAAYQPAAIPRHDHQRKDHEPYAELLHPLGTQYDLDMTFAMRHELDEHFGDAIPHDFALNSLATRHPYHPAYFREYVRATGPEIWRGLSPWIAEVVPYPPLLENLVWTLRFDAGERAATIAALEPALARRQDAAFALTLDTALRSGPDPDLKAAHAVLDAALVEFPFDERLFEQSAWVALDVGRFELAEQRFTNLSLQADGLREGCLGLAQLARRQQALPRAEKVLVDCAARATDAWDRHVLLIRAANMQRDDGRYAESLATVERASVGIGESRAVLEGRAASWALSGDLDRAAAALERSHSYYRSGGWESAVALADLELARGDSDRANELYTAIRDAGFGNRGKAMALARRIALARGDLDGFESLCREMKDDGLYPLALFQWEIRGDAVSALASLSEVEAARPNDAAIAVLRGEILLANGDPEAALAEARRAYAIEKSDEAIRLEIESQLARGALDEVAAWVASRLASDRWSIPTWEHRARLEIAKGDPAAARATLAWATGKLRQPGIGGEFAWWQEIRPLLLLESSLVGKTSDPASDARLESLLSATVKRLPNDPELWQALSRVREQLGEVEGARTAQKQLARVWPRHSEPAGGTKLPAALGFEASTP